MIRNSRTPVHVAFALLVALLGLDTAMAANPMKEAKKLLKQTAVDVRKDFAKEAKLQFKLLDAELDAVDDKLKAGLGGASRVYEVHNALVDFQVAMHDEIREASDEFRVGTGAAMSILQSAGIAMEDRPDDFFYGGQGTSDDLNDAMIEEIRKVYAKVEKRLRKTRKLFADEVDWCLNFRVDEPVRYLEWVVGPSGSGAGHHGVTLTIDIAIAASDRAVDGDVLLLFSGSCYTQDGSLEATVVHSNGFYTIPTIPVGANDRWSHAIADQAESNYSFGIRVPSVVVGGDYAAVGAD